MMSNYHVRRETNISHREAIFHILRVSAEYFTFFEEKHFIFNLTKEN